MSDAIAVPFRRHATTPAATTAAGRYEALDSLRGVAALMVVLFHCEILSHLNGWTLVRRGEVFVDFFFVLSGFVIAKAYAGRLGDATALARFAILRIGRIWPLHMAMLGAFVAVEIVKYAVPAFGAGGDPAFSGANDPWHIPTNILLVHAFGLDGELSWNTPSWSISAEMAAYAVFGLAAYFAPRRLGLAMLAAALAALAVLAGDAEGMATTAVHGAERALFGFGLGALLAVAFHRQHDGSPDGLRQSSVELPPPLTPPHKGEGETRLVCLERGISPDRTLGRLSGSPPPCGEGSGVGVNAVAKTDATKPAAGLTATAAELAAATLVIAAAFVPEGDWRTFLAPFAFAVAVHVFAQEAGPVSALLRLKPFAALGGLSYGVYMVHMFLNLRLLNLGSLADKAFGWHVRLPAGEGAGFAPKLDFGGPWAGDAATLALIGLVVLAAMAAKRWIEDPGRALARRLAARSGV